MSRGHTLELREQLAVEREAVLRAGRLPADEEVDRRGGERGKSIAHRRHGVRRPLELGLKVALGREVRLEEPKRFLAPAASRVARAPQRPALERPRRLAAEVLGDLGGRERRAAHAQGRTRPGRHLLGFVVHERIMPPVAAGLGRATP